MTPQSPFSYYKEYYRVVAKIYVTEEGLFKEVPEDLASSKLEVEVVYRICVANDGGELQVIDFLNNPPAMGADRKVGGPVTIDGKEWFTEPGEGTSTLACVTRYTSNESEEWKSRAQKMHDIAKDEDNIQGVGE